jgi:hypothetical protein
MLGIGNILITTDYFILKVADQEIIKIHRNTPNALRSFKQLIFDAIDFNNKSMNEVCDWSKPIPLKSEYLKLKKEMHKHD